MTFYTGRGERKGRAAVLPVILALVFLFPLHGFGDGTGKASVPDVNREALLRLIDRAAKSGSDSTVIVMRGKTVFARYSRAGRRPLKCMSITKSVTSLAIGRLITTGKLKSIDEPVYAFFPAWDHGKKRLVTIRHLLNHTSGLEDAIGSGNAVPPNPDFVQLALESKVVYEPGTRFSYNNNAVNLLSGIVRIASGLRLDLFVGEEIFAPLGIRDYSWDIDSGGNALAMTGLHISARDLVTIGQFMLNEGSWKRRQIIRKEWIRESVTPAQSFAHDSGLLWWTLEPPSEGFFARGHGGQYLVVIPAHALIAVRQVRLTKTGGKDFQGFPVMVRGLVP